MFHRIWLGSQPMPTEFEEFSRSWSSLHPSWKVITWTDESRPPLENESLFERAPNFAQKSDILRYELLLRFGGVYLDTDFECLQSIDPLLAGVDGFAAMEDWQTVSAGIIGCTPWHPLIQTIVQDLPRTMLAGQSQVEQSGPAMLTRSVMQYLDCHPGSIYLFGEDFFYPYHYSEPDRRHESFPHAFAVHHWAGSWLDRK